MSVLFWTGRCLLVGCLLLNPLVSRAAEQAPAAPTAPFDCSAGTWRLAGAPARVDADASFNPEWTPTLQALAACIKSPTWQTVCLTIRGHSDEVKFDSATASAFGSPEAAQLSRANGRSLRVTASLYELGVPGDRLRQLPPSGGAEFRGVEITAHPGCIAGPTSDAPGKPVDPALLQQMVKSSVKEVLDEQKPVPVPPAPHLFWAEAGLDAALVGFSPSTSIGPVLRAGAGWRHRWAYARANLGFSVGSIAPQRIGGEVALGAGYIHAPWLQLGLTASARLSTHGLLTPWLEQTWALGVEGTHCLWNFSGYQLCAREAVLPLGVRVRQGEEIAGQVYRIHVTNDFSLRFDVGLVLRRDL